MLSFLETINIVSKRNRNNYSKKLKLILEIIITMDSCSICADNFTSYKRKPVNCPRCEFQCCITCLKRHCLNGNDPMCMNPDCRTQFENSFLQQQFPKAFLNGEYKDKRTEVLWQREQGLLDSTMPFVEARVALNNTEDQLKQLRKQQREIERQVLHQQLLVRESKRNCHRLETGVEKIAKEKKNFIRKCTNGDCRGFLNSRYKCELCQTQVCAKCFEIKENEHHLCNPDMVKTAELLRKDTKPCPNCAEMIYKISGCDQMYCTTCSSAFSWNTGQIVTGVIHNPHYFEYRRQNGGVPRQPGDILCGGIPTPQDIQNRVKELVNPVLGNPAELVPINPILCQFWRFLQFSQHFRDIVIPRYQDVVDRTRNPDEINRNNRIRYLMNQLNEEEFKKVVYKEEKDMNNRREYLHIYNTMTTLIEDQLQLLMHENTKSIQDLNNIVDECLQIIIYINNCFQQLSNTYKTKTPLIMVPDSPSTPHPDGRHPNYLKEIHNGTIPEKKK